MFLQHTIEISRLWHHFPQFHRTSPVSWHSRLHTQDASAPANQQIHHLNSLARLLTTHTTWSRRFPCLRLQTWTHHLSKWTTTSLSTVFTAIQTRLILSLQH